MKNSIFPVARTLLASAVILSQACFPGLSQAQVPAVTIPVSTQFDQIGFIQAATLDPTCGAADNLCGGSITVNDIKITVPRNTILQMPAAALTWKEVFTLPRQTTRAGVSGLALQDVITTAGGSPNNTYEVHVQGNRIRTATGDEHIAGLLFLGQSSLQTNQGYINWIDYATGEFRVGGLLGSATTGARVKINDPLGRFSRQWSPDVRFTIDENNPTISSRNGTPMCIPRTNPATADDPWCPQKNRPFAAGSPSGFAMIYTMQTVAQAIGFPGGTDPRKMVPFEIGDYVTYSGIVVESDPTLLAAWAVEGNVGAKTALGDSIQFVRTGVALLGNGGVGAAGAVEATIRTRFEGFTSASSANPAAPSLIDIWGVDVNCAGIGSSRIWGTIDVDSGPPGGAVAGRWRFRPPINGGAVAPGVFQAPTFLPATREVLVTVRDAVTGLPMTAVTLPTADGGGLTVNRYQAPIFDFLFPENVATGTPIVPLNFDTMPFLAKGSGLISGLGSQTVGTLSPWPGDVVPTTGCAPFVAALPNAAIAPANQSATVSGTVPVTMVGSGVDPQGAPITSFRWTQTAGPIVNLIGATTATASFLPTAPGTLTFSLVVTSVNGTSAAATATVTVVSVAIADQIIPTLVEYRISKQRLTVTVTDAAGLTLPGPTLTVTPYSGPNATGTPATPMTMGNLGGGLYSVIGVGVARPGSVKITSSAGGVSVQNADATNPIFKLRQ